ncbi:MAG: hypothetical protein WD928_10185 [Gammaproteobacteria bacterium]
MPIRNHLPIAALFFFCTTAAAAQEGRYQAIPIDTGFDHGTEKALILDSVAGHLWIWVESPPVNGEPGGRYIIYQGQLEPGQEMGQIMDKQEWVTAPGKPIE